MENARDYTKLIARQTEVESALATLDKFYFDRNKPSRFISGVALSSRKPNANEDSFIAHGVNFSLPAPLLWDHDWARPLGRVLGIEVRGEKLHYRAEVGNAMPWTDQIWEAIKARTVEMSSVEGISLLDTVIERTYRSWQLREISVVQLGADPGAIITRCAERVPVIYVDGRPSETVHWSAP